jgi:HEAT repeat protein
VSTTTKPKRVVLWYVIIGLLCAGGIAALGVRYARRQAVVDQLSSRDMRFRVAAARTLLDAGGLADLLPAQTVPRRSCTAEALGEIADPDAIALLTSILRDPDDLPQTAAIKALAKIGPPAIPALIGVLQRGDDRAKDAAVVALGKIGPAAIPDLRTALSDGDSRDRAAKALGEIGSAASSTLIMAAATRGDKDVAKIAITVLGDKHVRPAVPALLNALRDNDLRVLAIRALGSIGDPAAAPALVSYVSDPALRIDAARALGQLGHPVAVQPLVATLGETDRDYRTALVWALQRIGAPAVPALTAALRSPDRLVREAAAESLIGDSDPRAIPSLRLALHDTDPVVRRLAARALGWPNNAAAVAPLIAALGDSDWQVVDGAVNSLASVGSPAVEPLLSVLRGGDQVDPVLNRHASRALAAMADAPTRRLLALLDSADSTTATWAAITLGDIGAREAIAPLRRLAKSDRGNLAWVARQQLRKLGEAEESIEARPAA